jgi:hypothetical protein
MSSNMLKTSLQGRFPAPVIPDGHISLTSNMANTFDAANNAAQSSGNTHRIDVFPNMRLQLTALTEEIIKVYGSLDPKESEYASPPALLAYCTILIHAHAFHTDLYYRNGPSPHATTIKNDANTLSFFDDLLDLPVPPIVHDVLKGLSRYESEAHLGLTFNHTYAGFRFEQDFPYLVPASLFFTAHDTFANAPGNAPPATLVDIWFRSSFLATGNARPGTPYRVAQFLGCLFDINNVTYVHHDWFNECMMRVFSPITQRFHKNRPFFNPMNIMIPLLNNTGADLNPYIHGTGYTHASRNRILEIMSKLGTFVSKQFKTTHNLGQVLATNTGSNIVNHFVSELLLPMHHHNTVNARNPAPATTPTPDPSTWVQATHAQMAQATDFLQYEANVAAANNTVAPPNQPTFRPFVPGNPPTQGPTTNAFSPDLLAVSTVTLAVTAADPSGTPPARWSNYPYSEVLFSETRHVTPDLIFSAPLNAPTSAIFSASISGLIIYSNEVDAISVPTHDPRVNLAVSNSAFFTGTVPLGITPNFALNEAIRYRERTHETTGTIRSSIALYDYSTNTIGRLAAAIPAAVTALTGFSPLDGIRYAWEQFSFLTYNSTRTTQHYGTKKVQVWSPYRHVANEASISVAFYTSYPGYIAPSTAPDGILTYTSLRGIFGSDTRTYGFPFPTTRFH